MLDTCGTLTSCCDALRELGAELLVVNEPLPTATDGPTATDAAAGVSVGDVTLSSKDIGMHIGNGLDWTGTTAVTKPMFVLPYAAPVRGKITSLSLRLSSSRRPSAEEPLWFLMLFEINAERGTGVIWSGRSIDVNTNIGGECAITAALLVLFPSSKFV